MTACAIADDAGVVHRRRIEATVLTYRMTGLARQTGRQVIARFGYRRHPGKYLAVVAGRATTKDPRMDHCRTGEISELGRRMAGLASQCGRQVVARFSYRRYAKKHLAVMASCTTVEDDVVIHHA